jgi:predicted Rossmann fold nucleotide-binding protein DprA/Smf involved in DNA uptake
MTPADLTIAQLETAARTGTLTTAEVAEECGRRLGVVSRSVEERAARMARYLPAGWTVRITGSMVRAVRS